VRQRSGVNFTNQKKKINGLSIGFFRAQGGLEEPRVSRPGSKGKNYRSTTTQSKEDRKIDFHPRGVTERSARFLRKGQPISGSSATRVGGVNHSKAVMGRKVFSCSGQNRPELPTGIPLGLGSRKQFSVPRTGGEGGHAVQKKTPRWSLNMNHEQHKQTG